MAEADVLVLGATGTTGGLTLQWLLDIGLRPGVAGRRRDALEALAASHGLRHAVVDIRDRAALAEAFGPYQVIVNCAGPFTRTGYAPLEAAIEAGVHYLDSSWEQAYLLEAFRLHAQARARGVTSVPGLGVSPGLSDLLVSIGAEQSPRSSVDAEAVDAVVVHYVEGMRNRFSYGTLISTAEALKDTALWLSDGEPVLMKAGHRRKVVSFPEPFGAQRVASYPGGDVANVPRYLPVQEVEHYFGAEIMTSLVLLLGRLPGRADSPITRAVCWCAEKLQWLPLGGRQGFAIVVELSGGSDGKRWTRQVAVTHDEPYRTTAALLAHGARALIESPAVPRGVLSPGMAFDAMGLLRAVGLDPTIT